MKTTKNRIEEIKTQGYNFDFGVTFNHAFEIYKKIAATAGLAFLIFSFVAGAVLVMYILTSLDWQHLSQNPEAYDLRNFSLNGIIIYMVVVILFTALSMPLNAGLIKMCYQAETGAEYSVATAFEYYKGHYFTKLFFYGVMVSLVTVGVSTMLEYFGIMFVGTIINIIILVFTFIALPLIIFGDLSPAEAIGASFTVISKQVLMVFLLVIVSYLVASAGIIACCIGIVFTLPIINAVQYSVYLHSVGFADNHQTEDFG